MSLLTLVQGVCDSIGFPRPFSVAGNADQLARQMFALANMELREISRRYNWPALDSTAVIPINIGQTNYTLPSDYRSIISSTAYSTSQYDEARGSLSPQEWRLRRQESLTCLDRVAFRIYGSPLQIVLDPAPSSTDTLTYEYMSKYYALDNNGNRQETYQVDTDVSAVDESLITLGLIWRIKHAKGLEFSADRAEYDMVIPREFARQLASPPIEVGGPTVLGPLTDPYVPYTGFGQ